MLIDTVVDERTLREIYLPGFRAAVREARPWTVMCCLQPAQWDLLFGAPVAPYTRCCANSGGTTGS